MTQYPGLIHPDDLPGQHAIVLMAMAMARILARESLGREDRKRMGWVRSYCRRHKLNYAAALAFLHRG